MIKLGLKIFNAVRKGYPLSANGLSKMPKALKFDLKNPYILEALPENKIDDFIKYDGMDLRAVCRQLNRPTVKKGFNDAELNALLKKAFPNIKVPTDVNCDAMVFLNGLPAEIGSKFDAHGIAKISVTDQLYQLNKLLTDGIDTSRWFHTAPLVPKGKGINLGTAGGAYRDGSFIIVGEKSKLITDGGIKHVLVNGAYYNIIKDLQQKFPDVGFVKAEDVVEYFSKL